MIESKYKSKCGPQVEVKCDLCNKSFLFPRKFIGRRPHKYCSRNCFILSRQKRVVVECAQCHQSITRPISRTIGSKSGLNFCSRACKEAAQRIESGKSAIQPSHYGTGDGSYNYRGRAISSYGAYCEECGYAEHKSVLDVHHIDEDRGNNAIENLIVLCPLCHAKLTRNVSRLVNRRLVNI